MDEGSGRGRAVESLVELPGGGRALELPDDPLEGGRTVKLVGELLLKHDVGLQRN